TCAITSRICTIRRGPHLTRERRNAGQPARDAGGQFPEPPSRISSMPDLDDFFLAALRGRSRAVGLGSREGALFSVVVSVVAAAGAAPWAGASTARVAVDCAWGS